MKRYLLVALAAPLLSGCLETLHVGWVFHASYNATAETKATIPAPPEPAKAAPATPASAAK